MGFIRLLGAVLLLAASCAGDPVVTGRLLINNGLGGNYSPGQPWTLQLTGAPPDVVFTICAQLGESAAFCTPAFATTDQSGAWSASGRFEPEHSGEWTEWVQFPSGSVSNRVSFTVSRSPSGTLSINHALGGVYPPGGSWTLALTGAPPNTPFDLCVALNTGPPTCFPGFGVTGPAGNWSLTGAFPAWAAGGWTEWARFPSGAVSNRISFTVGMSVSYLAHGMNFGPFIDGADPNLGATITEAELRERLSRIAPYAKQVRSFGSTRGLEHFARLARGFGLKTAPGAWLGRDLPANEQEIAGAIAAYRDGHASMLVIGSETLHRRDLSAAEIVSYLNRVRQSAPGARITTADTYASLMDHPEVVAACDFIFVNIYPYWQGTGVDLAIAQLHSNFQRLKARYPNKEIVISETGWPSGGNPVGAAVPSLENASRYFLNFVSWARAFNVEYFYFAAFDEPFKAAYEGPQGAFWGIMNPAGLLKPGMLDVFGGRTIADNWSSGGEDLPGGQGTPAISFTTVPAKGSQANLRGQALHVKPADHYVAVLIRVHGGWWTKPTWEEPRTRINPDGSWVCDITTGGSDPEADQIAAYLLPNSVAVPLASGGALPQLAGIALASAIVTR